MFKYYKLIIIIIIILFTQTLYSETNSQTNDSQTTENVYYRKKDPFIAGLLSASMMGLGQFYTKDYFSGSMFLLNDFIQKGLLILLVSNFNNKYTDENDDLVEWKEIDNTDRIFAIGFAAYYFGFKLYCIIDAMASAEKYNKNLEREFAQKNIEFNYFISKPLFSVSVSKRF